VTATDVATAAWRSIGIDLRIDSMISSATSGQSVRSSIGTGSETFGVLPRPARVLEEHTRLFRAPLALTVVIRRRWAISSGARQTLCSVQAQLGYEDIAATRAEGSAMSLDGAAERALAAIE
jgi:hypothetical protein